MKHLLVNQWKKQILRFAQNDSQKGFFSNLSMDMNVGKLAAIAKKYLISGMVQGVGYRFFAVREAKSLGLRGYVKNLADGRVEVYAIGNERALQKFKRRLGDGPRSALVKRVEETEEPLDSLYTGFSIEA